MAETSTLRDRRRHQTEREIQRAAVSLAIEQGYCALTTDLIATRAGISLRTFFNYYPNKDAALVGPFTPISEESKQLFREATGTLIDDLFDVVARQLAAKSLDRELISMIGELLETSPELLAIYHAPLEKVHNDLVALAQERAPSEDLHALHLLAHTVTYAVSTAFHRWATDDAMTQDQLVVQARSYVDRLGLLLKS
ncbi:TetR family transcriptional regulator [Paracoccus caeni]|uniref:TetR family transcriptional regulator n=1 Tax=Paracoccus caeni TaxID=657651 RepID=A0A934SGW5_9RHOB|nr:TetR/AcrR family transcriptional regulator [Paracoccus caeni]MBK4214969.1 TetR family transcriptional regulator [Paracoccus caeni]